MLAIALPLALALTAQVPAPPGPPFPPSTALEEGISPEGLQDLSDLVLSFVDRGEIVGAELLVIVHGHTILHQGYGWRDRDREVPMQPGGVFCVRSMTKPLIGAATWMLIETGELGLDDRVAGYLPAFDVEGRREITLRHLLTHTSGLPMSLIMGGDPRALKSLRAVADLGGDCKLECEPGSEFHYSDQGTDTLTAIIEIVTGAPAEEMLRERLLEPLGMVDTTCLMSAGHPLRARTCSAYAGSAGAWIRFWSPEDEALFPIFLGSQGLYSTAVDYARFLDSYLPRGRADGRRLLGTNSVRSTLLPGPYGMAGSTALPGLRADYGMLMQVWTRAGDAGEREAVVFGHTGSDGTHAWAFPEQDAMVLYFTQSRGTMTGLRVEEHLGALLLGVAIDAPQAAPAMDEYLGYYWEGEGDLYRAIVRDGDDLALEIVGKAVVPLDYVGKDRWKLRPQPSTLLAFDRDEAGVVTGYHIGDHVEYRFTARADLPTVDDVAGRVAGAHRLEHLADAGVVRLDGEIEIPKLGLRGDTMISLAWPDQWRVDEVLGEEVSHVAFDGETFRRSSSAGSVEPLEGEVGLLLLQSDPFLRFGDWRREGVTLTVIQELDGADGHVLLVRAGDTSGPAPTMYVDLETGRVVRMDGLILLDGVGRLGQKVRFGDWREVSGALLPFRVEVELAHPLIGTILNTYESFEVGVKVDAGWFTLDPDAP